MISRFLDLIYPALCELCQEPLKNGHALCSSCAAQLTRVKAPFCGNCGEPFEGDIQHHFLCPNCLHTPHDFHFARASLKSSPTSFGLVHRLKYQRHFYLARDLAPFLKETLQEDPRFEKLGKSALLIPVPLHWRRQQSRHGNQALELSRELAKLSGLSCHNALKRIRVTRTQTKLNRKQRLTNLRGAFQIKQKQRKHLHGKNIILIDDVFTTGSTAHECARILTLEGQVSKVAVLTLIRG